MTTITQTDVAAAETFLVQFLQDNVPDGDFTAGTALRDLTVAALAYIFAYLESEAASIKNNQSLELLKESSDTTDTTEAVNQILANWFLTRKSGVRNYGDLTLHFSKSVDITIPATTRFFLASDSIYLPKSGGVPIVIAADDLIEEVDTTGTVTGYTTTIQVEAIVPSDTEVLPRRWLAADAFSSSFTYAENLLPLSNGKVSETNAEFIARASTAISTRTLVNSRSIDTIIKENFSSVLSVLVQGYGDPAMLRDTVVGFGHTSDMHVGGAADVYIDSPTVRVEESLGVGAAASPTSSNAVYFKDAGFPSDFVSAGVQPGQILNILSGIPEAPEQFIIAGVTPAELTVSGNKPFSIATETLITPTLVQYSIGALAPAFADVVAVRSTLGGDGTSNTYTHSGMVTLTSRPVLKIHEVSIPNSSAGLATLRVPGTTRIDFATRTNKTPIDTTDYTALEYRVLVADPYVAQSSLTQLEIEVGEDRLPGVPSKFDGETLKVVYDTYSEFSAVDSYVTSSLNRIVTHDTLVRGFNYVGLSLEVAYTAFEDNSITIDHDLIRSNVANYINLLDPTDTLDVSDITLLVRKLYVEAISGISPITIVYKLSAPDGQVYEFSTTNVVSIFPNTTTGSSLTNNNDLAVPVADESELPQRFLELGITDKTIKYLVDPSDITVIDVTNVDA